MLQGHIRACPSGIKALVDKALTHSQRAVMDGKQGSDAVLERLLEHLYAGGYATRKLSVEAKTALADALGMSMQALDHTLASFVQRQAQARDLLLVNGMAGSNGLSSVQNPALAAQNPVPITRSSMAAAQNTALPIAPLPRRAQGPAQEPAQVGQPTGWTPYEYPPEYADQVQAQVRARAKGQDSAPLQTGGMAGLTPTEQESVDTKRPLPWWAWVGLAGGLYWMVRVLGDKTESALMRQGESRVAVRNPAERDTQNRTERDTQNRTEGPTPFDPTRTFVVY